jgi:hypothetical protein
VKRGDHGPSAGKFCVGAGRLSPVGTVGKRGMNPTGAKIFASAKLSLVYNASFHYGLLAQSMTSCYYKMLIMRNLSLLTI